MTFEQKIMACQAIGSFSLRMRRPGDWYVDHSCVEKTNGSILDGGCVTEASTPEAAVEQHWAWLTNLKPNQTIVVNANAWRDNRRELRWNGFIWEDAKR
jgi:hypothetical protein